MARFSKRKLAVWAGLFAPAACAGPSPQHAAIEPSPPTPSASARVAEPAPKLGGSPAAVKRVVSSTPASDLDLERRFRAHLAGQRDLEFAGLEHELSLVRKPDAPLSFNPEAARYATLALDKLALSPAERDTFRRDGVVNVDHRQRYSMGSAYYAVFTRDLPVLVTTDSILHALHRSYDEVVASLEMSEFTSALNATLEKSHEALRGAKFTTPKLKTSATDVDLYLTVARSLLADSEAKDASAVRSALGNDAQARLILGKIAKLELETSPNSAIYGGHRAIDYSQFRPRGHYTASPELARYFKAMIWLGRADTGFVLAPPQPNTGIRVDAERELRSAALLALVLEQSGELGRFQAMAEAIDFLVGGSDNLSVPQLLKALHDAGIHDPNALEQTGSVVALQGRVAQLGRQQIRSQVLTPPRGAEADLPPPNLFQLFGQRLMVDSFVLSRVVYDSISFRGTKMERKMPTGLDVMAALGSDEATRLLRPELERFNYSPNLLAARRTVDDLRPEDFEHSLAGLWLDSLRKLDDIPERASFPEAMRRTPFLRKQLQTQLASWAELRHDTVLYAKQSYSGGIMCQYPEGYVEPYPEFFARVALLAERAGKGLSALQPRYADFFSNFSDTMRYLETLARKELESKPFTAEESGFLKKTIDAKGFGCGPPTYDGWYTRLFFGGGGELWKPTVSDVHTDPNSGQVLQEGVGDANFIVVAVDNRKDRAVYVGPVYSYYEFTRSAFERMTDEEWRTAIERQAEPARPAWWKQAFPAEPLQRTLARQGLPPKESDPRVLALDVLRKKAEQSTSKEERERLYRELSVRQEATHKPPLSNATAKP